VQPKAAEDGAFLAVHVTPKARANQLGPLEGGVLRVHVTAAASEGAANDAVVRLLAKELGVPKTSLAILSGHRARQKRILVRRLDADELAGRLSLALGIPPG
jgi:uncharacterized protein (TIGR00251 family)